jgi:hypothetical protein
MNNMPPRRARSSPPEAQNRRKILPEITMMDSVDGSRHLMAERQRMQRSSTGRPIDRHTATVQNSDFNRAGALGFGGCGGKAH